ncbi:MAG UNVERIFIED_CONTAM: plasmid stabilization protein [Anaerolineae bacterium]
MSSLTIRNLDDATKQCLRIQAARHGVSMEEEVRRILKAAVHSAEDSSYGLGKRLQERFAGLADDAFELPERHQPRTAPQWDEPV